MWRIALCVWLALVTARMGCAGASATIDMPSGDARLDRPTIERVIREAITDARVTGLKFDEPLRIRVNGPLEQIIPEVGVGGYSVSSHEIWIAVAPAMRPWAALRRCVAHELAHCARWRTVGYGQSLAEAIVSEGLADHFAVEVYGPPAGIWTRALSDRQFDTLRKLALTDPCWKRPGATRAWLAGSRKRRIPRWTGYALGWRAVAGYLARHGGTRASQLASIPALSILRGAGPDWGE